MLWLKVVYYMYILQGWPTWAVYLLLRKFSFKSVHVPKRISKKSLLSGRKLTLYDWTSGRTDLCKEFDTAFWIYIVICLGYIVSIIV